MSTRMQEGEQRQLDHDIARIGWALLFVMTGLVLLLQTQPGFNVFLPEGTWLVLAGLILIGAQVARSINHIAMRTFSLLLGVGAILFGLAAFAGFDLPVLPILLILIGVSIVVPAGFGGERGRAAARA